MCSVIWCGLTWEAFATLVTGLLAVASAAVIGGFQLRLFAQQSSILDRQVRLQELSVREALFDRRMEVYSAALEFLEAVLRSGELSFQGRFEEAMAKAAFLFRPEVHEGLEAALLTARGYSYARERRRTFPEGWESGPTPQALIDEEKVAHARLMEVYANLQGLFGEEIRLGSDR